VFKKIYVFKIAEIGALHSLGYQRKGILMRRIRCSVVVSFIPPGASYGPQAHVDRQCDPYADESVVGRKVHQARYGYGRHPNLKVYMRLVQSWEKFQS
jgi:hypothetical protein